MTSSDSAPVKQQKNWFARNWHWFVPTGCLSAMALIVAFAIGVLFLVTSLMKNSEPYETAVALASENSIVQEHLGSPLKEGFFTIGSIQLVNSNGTVDINIPVSGPKGSASIHVVGEKKAGKWTYSTMLITIENTDVEIELSEK